MMETIRQKRRRYDRRGNGEEVEGYKVEQMETKKKIEEIDK